MGIWLYLLIYVVVGTAGLLLMRLGLVEIDGQTGLPLLSRLLNLKLIAGVACYGVSFLTFTFMLSREAVTYAMPLATGASYIASVVAAHFILGERLSAAQVVGVALIGAGIVLVMAVRRE